MSALREAALRLDPETLAAVADVLREAGGCDRAVAIVEEMRRGGVPEAAPIFNAVQATLSYVRARGVAHEDDVLRAVEAREAEHAERTGGDDPAPKPLAHLRLIGDLVARGDLVRDGQTVIWPRSAVVLTDSWGGRAETPVTVVGETPTSYRCRWEKKGVGRAVGEVRMVPRSAVRFVEATHAPAVDTRMGCVERAVPRRRAGA